MGESFSKSLKAKGLALFNVSLQSLVTKVTPSDASKMAHADEESFSEKSRAAEYKWRSSSCSTQLEHGEGREKKQALFIRAIVEISMAFTYASFSAMEYIEISPAHL